MNEELIALIENSGFISNSRLNVRIIKEQSLDNLLKFCEQFSELSDFESIVSDRTTFSHASSLALSGSRHPCASLDCRNNKISELCQFAAMYSDRIYSYNFLQINLHHPDTNKQRFKAHLVEDLIVLATMYPLIKSGNIVPVTFSTICPTCLVVRSTSSTKNNVDNTFDSLCDRYLREVSHELTKIDNEYVINVTGPDDLIPHGFLRCSIYKESKQLTALLNATGKIKNGGKLNLNSDLLKILSIDKDFIGRIKSSVAFEVGSSHYLKSSYLSESDLEINIVMDVTEGIDSRRKSMLMQKYLTCVVPFLPDIPIESLLQLRKNENEHFIVFRQALMSAVNEYIKGDDKFNDSTAQQIYFDIVQPHLAKLDLKVKSAKRHFVKDTRRELVGWAGALSVGIAVGASMNLLAGTAAFGAIKAGSDLLNGVMSKSDSEESIKGEDMYFLWKARNLAQNE